jgi:hypothetical protein
LLAGCQSEADVVILVDSSNSLISNFQNNWPVLLGFVKNVIGQLDLSRVRVSVIRYGNNANIEFTLDRYNRVDDMQRAVDNIIFLNQASNIAAAFRVRSSGAISLRCVSSFPISLRLRTQTHSFL